MPPKVTARKQVPRLTNPVRTSSKKRRLSLSQDETPPRQRLRTSPVTDDDATPPVNATPAAITPALSETTRNNSPVDETDETDETSETQLSMLPHIIYD
jgi:hypothetical protein